jgi:hypothetical protein
LRRKRRLEKFLSIELQGLSSELGANTYYRVNPSKLRKKKFNELSRASTSTIFVKEKTAQYPVVVIKRAFRIDAMLQKQQLDAA